MKTGVCISVDTEFSIGGAFGVPGSRKPIGGESVWCNSKNKSEGLGFILEALSEYNLKATFFVEALNTMYFDSAEMGNIAYQLYEKEQDVQLHIHPCWSYFENANWRSELKHNPPNDNIDKRDLSEMVRLLQYGVDEFRKWGIPRPIAVRAGNLDVNADLYQALHQCGIGYSSNIGVGVNVPDNEKLNLFNGIHNINEVTEIPVFTYYDLKLPGYSHMKCFTIIGCSLGEMIFLLENIHAENYGPVMILTHPSEFAHVEEDYSEIKPNITVQRRFRELCRYLSENNEKFEVTTFTLSQNTWKENTKSLQGKTLVLPVLKTIKKLMQKKLNMEPV
jgi:hypothetical protein